MRDWNLGLGGGTAENVAMMDKYIPIKSFKKVYVVDLCASLCRVARFAR